VSILSIKVSIITPAYNAEKYLNETIKSVQNQTYQQWEMIIVDDCSSDNTYAVALQYAEEDKRIKVLKNNHNLGVSATRNVALDIATGEYVAFLDSDDQWTSDKLQHQLTFMEANDYVLTYTDYQLLNNSDGSKGKIIQVPKRMSYGSIYKNTAIACLTVVINRKKSGSFHMPLITHTEDQITWQEILKRGYTAYGLNENLALYRVGNISLTNSKKSSVHLQWHTYRDYHNFSVTRSLYYLFCYSVNAFIKHFL